MVAAPGPSLTSEVAERVKGANCTVVAVQDAWRMLPWADVLYGCDARWWEHHRGVPEFQGERWSTHDEGTNDKRDVAERYGVLLVAGKQVDGFSLDPSCIHYGSNSGFQAVNLALLFGASTVVLVGFDMQTVGGRRHFFGDHPAGLRNQANFSTFIRPFERAARKLPDGVRILNATPGSALRCFPMVSLDAALSNRA